MTTISEIADWFRLGKSLGASHMIVMVDTFNWNDYPVFAGNLEEAQSIVDKPGDMQRVEEVYDLEKNLGDQLAATRIWNL